MSKEQITSIVEIRNLIDKEITKHYGSNRNETEYRKKLLLVLETIEQALEDLELYKKAFELATNPYQTIAFKNVDNENETETLRSYFLDQARKELSK